MAEVPRLLDDPREIRRIVFSHQEISGLGWLGQFSVGASPCRAIKAYAESGQHADIAWVSVHGHDGDVIARFPAHNLIAIGY